MSTGRLRARSWRVLADARRLVTRSGSAQDALEHTGGSDRSNLANWNAQTGEGHSAYRNAVALPQGRAAVVCVSMRPHLVAQVVANVEHQDVSDLDVVFVANSGDFDRETVESAFACVRNVVIDEAPHGTSLGEALNRGMRLTDARFVAKIDDDDIYGPRYLSDMLRAHGYAGAGVVGKHSYYAYMAHSEEYALRFGGNEFRYSGTLAGGTLVVDRNVVDDQRFDDVSLGEDRAFLARCHRRGISTFSADRFNFVQVRTGTNTWALSDGDFLAQSAPVDADERINR